MHFSNSPFINRKEPDSTFVCTECERMTKYHHSDIRTIDGYQLFICAHCGAVERKPVQQDIKD